MKTLLPCLFVLLSLLPPGPGLEAAITGTVVDDVTGLPVEGARVRVQTTLGAPVLTAADGGFSVDDPPPGLVEITAVLSYDSTRPVNYITRGVGAVDGDHIEIRLQRLPEDDRPGYNPGSPLSDCSFCHDNQTNEWLDSTHSNAAQNEWVLDLFSGTGTPGGSAGYVFRDLHDPDDTGFCAVCHAPLEDVQNPGGVFLDEVSTNAGMFGVSCLACHQMAEVNTNVSALHHLGNAQYRFPDEPDAHLWVWGPLDDVSFGLMRASHQPLFSEPLFCASCHEYNNPTTGAPGQNTYTEWLAGPYSNPGPDFRACQDCHMPAASEPGPVSSLGGQPIRDGSQRRNHQFIGATPTTLQNAIALNVAVDQSGSELVIDAVVSNHGAGHHFPTGISIRNAVLVIEADHAGVPLAQTAGPVIPFYGSAEGGDSADDVAGLPGRGFARVLEGRINGQGPVVRPVLFIDAEGVWEDTTIPSGGQDVSSYRFDLSGLAEGETVNVSAQLLYRRAWRNLAVTKGWTETPTGGPIEIEVAVDQLAWTVQQAGPGPAPEVLPVPTLDRWALLLLITGFLLAGWGLAGATRMTGRR